MNKKILLVILDGWGLAETWGGNAIALAKTPTMDKLIEDFPNIAIQSYGEAVGLPFGEPGNSEVGHLNIGTGQMAGQGLTAINQKINDKSFYSNKILEKLFGSTIKNDKNLHLIGLLSDGGIHSHLSHLFALLEMAKNNGLKNVYIHIISDGRDSPPTSGLKYLKSLRQKTEELGIGKISSVSGRYYAMDRDNNWDRIEKSYNVVTGDNAENTCRVAEEAFTKSYANGTTDEFILPTITKEGKPILDGDSLVFFNYRSDRAKQIARALADKDFKEFKRNQVIKNLTLATFASYQEGLNAKIIFEPTEISGQLPKLLSDHKLLQLHVAETEKYAHVTYFFNGGLDQRYIGEDRILVASPAVKTYDLRPEMSAAATTKKTILKLEKNNFTVINYANADMVGHTGNFKAVIKAVEFTDHCLGQLLNAAFKYNVLPIITADHGNAEQMISPLTGQPDTEHTNNPVPFIVATNKKIKLKKDGALKDIAPTLLDIYGLPVSDQMQGKCIIQ